MVRFAALAPGAVDVRQQNKRLNTTYDRVASVGEITVREMLVGVTVEFAGAVRFVALGTSIGGFFASLDAAIIRVRCVQVGKLLLPDGLDILTAILWKQTISLKKTLLNPP